MAVRRRSQVRPESPRLPPISPPPHPSGARPPAIPAEFVPGHVAIVMDGNGRWANARGQGP
jgi:undecaprenyl diphosphate synthase